MRTLLLILVCFAVFSVSAVSVPSPAQTSPCDPALKPAPESPNRYSLQSDDPARCEGVYTNRVGAIGDILLVSLTAGNIPLDPTQTRRVTLFWQSPPKTPTRLRAYSLRQRLNYRMDALPPIDANPYVLSLAIPAALGFRANEIGLVAWTSTNVGSRAEDVYFPLSASETGQGIPIAASFLAGDSLTNIVLTSSHLNTRNEFEETEQLTRTGRQPAQVRIDFLLRKSNASGFYNLNIGARDSGGQPRAGSFWIYLP